MDHSVHSAVTEMSSFILYIYNVKLDLQITNSVTLPF